MGNQIAGAIGAAAFWMFVAAAAVTSILGQYFKHRETQKTIRQAIESGQVLGADTVAKLIAANNQPPPNRRGLVFIGTLFVCLGLGVGVIGWTSAMDKPGTLYQALGPAALLCLLSVPFFVAAWMAPKRDGTPGR
jgi:hypothetical protein